MSSPFSDILSRLEAEGNLRSLPRDGSELPPCIDFSTNDYMGLAARVDLQERFMADPGLRSLPMSASASRLLAPCQRHHAALEGRLEELYGRPVLLFNSGYHANTGIIAAIASAGIPVVADRLVHASIIDGMVLSRTPFSRFPHNDFDALERALSRETAKAERVMVIVESVYSMDGDRADITRLADIKRRYPQAIIYVDEAHAFGVEGDRGLGLAHGYPEIDIIVGTFGKAAASAGAFAAVSAEMKAYLINRARSLIFSTALPPISAAWTLFMVDTLTGMDAEREHLRQLAARLHRLLPATSAQPSHILPWITGDPRLAVELSGQLRALGFSALPIRTPTVPAGTERLRFSLSAAMTAADIDRLGRAIKQITCN